MKEKTRLDHYNELVENCRVAIVDNSNPEPCFGWIKVHVEKNFEPDRRKELINEIDLHKFNYDNFCKAFRTNLINFDHYSQHLSKCVSSVLSFIRLLEPPDAASENVAEGLVEIIDDPKPDYFWDYQNNVTIYLQTSSSLPFTDNIFEQFAEEMDKQGRIHTRRFLQEKEGEPFIYIPKTETRSDDEILKEFNSEEGGGEYDYAVIEYQKFRWTDAVRVENRDNKGFVVAEAMLEKETSKCQFWIRVNGAQPDAKCTLINELLEWFEKWRLGKSEQFSICLPQLARFRASEGSTLEVSIFMQSV
jgi:hypothetical protein